MALVSRKGILAIAAVIDIALHATERPVSARELAARNGLPPRHLEPVLQALVREGILRGIRGPGGGYELAGAQQDISAESILRAAGTADDEEDVLPAATSPLLTSVVVPAVSQAEQIFCEALARISIEDMVQRAEGMIKSKRK
jgi:Rrf2 family transcriptional regulator, iron-sulfur cluster assembly transcription factor